MRLPRPADAGLRERPGVIGDCFPRLWERHRSIKLLRPIPAGGGDGTELAHPARVIEIDWIVASSSEWQRCRERQQAGWDVTELSHGLILAERTIG